MGCKCLVSHLLAEYQKRKVAAFWTQVKGLTNNNFGYDNLAAASDRPYGGTGSSYADPSLTSFMGTLSYTLLDRYTLNLTTRADGSSMVGKDHTWGIFPSISASWDLKKERFLRNCNTISLLNLRTGYGRSGNLGGISSYLTLRQYIPVGLVPYNGTPTVTMGTLRNSNPDLRWETRSTSISVPTLVCSTTDSFLRQSTTIPRQQICSMNTTYQYLPSPLTNY